MNLILFYEKKEENHKIFIGQYIPHIDVRGYMNLYYRKVYLVEEGR